MIPTEARCLESHEWVILGPDTGAPLGVPRTATIGLSDFAVEQLGDIVFLELPAEGDKVRKGQSFGTIESVKAASDLYSPLTGVVLGVNQQLPDNLELFKTDPYGQAWMIKVKPADEKEFETLMDARQYQQYLKEL